MKSTRKHELQTNELAEALSQLIEKARPHGVAIASIGLVIIALVIAVVVVPALRSDVTPEAKAAMGFSNAQMSGESTELRNFLRDNPTAPQVPLAKMMLADRILHDVVAGIDRTGQGDVKSKAPALLAEAKDLYAQAATSTNLAPLCQVGEALVTIQGGDIEGGRKALEDVIKAYPNLPASDIAKGHLEDLAAYKSVTFSAEALPSPTSTDTRPSPLMLSPMGSAGFPGMDVVPTGSAGATGTTATPTGTMMVPAVISTPTGTMSMPMIVVPEPAPTGTASMPKIDMKTPAPTSTAMPKLPDAKAADTATAPTATPKG